MDAICITRTGSEYTVTNKCERPLSVLSQTLDEAETLLLSGLNVWIPATMRAALADKLGVTIGNANG